MSTMRYYNPTLRGRIMRGDEPWWLKRHPRRKYIVACNLATPLWVDKFHMLELRRRCQAVSLSTGVVYVLDHIVPLTHPYVCGLNVPWNLKIMTRLQNAAKSNKWTPDQLELLPCDSLHCSCSSCSPPPLLLLPSPSPPLLTLPDLRPQRPLPLPHQPSP